VICAPAILGLECPKNGDWAPSLLRVDGTGSADRGYVLGRVVELLGGVLLGREGGSRNHHGCCGWWLWLFGSCLVYEREPAKRALVSERNRNLFLPVFG